MTQKVSETVLNLIGKELKAPLDVDFINFGEDKANDPSISAKDYRRLSGSWNIYYHGFMDRYDDIAYVKKPVEIEPGIYPIKTYGVDAYLFIWLDASINRLRGLITTQTNERWIADALSKYNACVTHL